MNSLFEGPTWMRAAQKDVGENIFINEVKWNTNTNQFMLHSFKFTSMTKSSQTSLTPHYESGSKSFNSKAASLFYEIAIHSNVAESTGLADMIEDTAHTHH